MSEIILPLVGVIVFVLGMIYIARRLVQGLRIGRKRPVLIIFIVVFALLALVVLGAVMKTKGALAVPVKWVGFIWVGFLVILIVALLLADLVLFIGTRIKKLKRPIAPKARTIATSCAIIVALAIYGCGFLSTYSLQVSEYSVKAHTTQVQSPLRIVLVSDLHIGSVASETRLQNIVDTINAQDADLVCIAGDLVDSDYNTILDPQGDAAILRQIKSKYGVYACWGNHDGGPTFEKVRQFAQDCNITVLEDEAVTIADRLVLVGRLDADPIEGGCGTIVRAGCVALPEGTQGRLPVVVMDHNPQRITDQDESVDLMLAGHTHNGQIFPGNIVSGLSNIVSYGYYESPTGTVAVVSSGCGTWGPPLRIAAPPDIAVVTLS